MRIGREADMVFDFPAFCFVIPSVVRIFIPSCGNGAIGNENDGIYIFQEM